MESMRKVETLPTGRFKVRFRLGRLQTSETFDTAREAREFAKWVDALGPQGAVDMLADREQQATIPTLDEIAAEHIAHLTGIEDGTRKTYTRIWERVWSPHLGAVQAHHLTRDHVARAVNELGKTYSHKSLENQRGLLAGVVQRAVEQGHLPKNVARGVRLPRGQEADRVEMRIISPEEFATVEARLPEHYRPFVRFLYGTGCRWGEAVALTVADVSLPNVRIRRALKWSPDNQRKVGATKTRKGNRTVVVGDVMLDDLRAACAGKAGTDLVWTAKRGGPILHRTFWSRYWLPAVGDVKCKDHKGEDRPDPKCSACRVGLEPRPRIHDLRHSHASILLARGVPIHVVQARLGHEKITTTVDTYGHLLPDAQAMAAEAASFAFTTRPAIG